MDPNETEPTEQAPQSGSDEGMVDIHEADIASLDSALENAQAIEKLEPLPEEGIDPNNGQTSEPIDPQLPNGKPDAAITAAPGVANQGAQPATPRVYTQEEVQGIIAENARRKNEGDQKELFIQHRGNELGELRRTLNATRQQLAQARAQLENGLEDRAQENPLQAIKDQDRIKEIDQQLSGIDTQESRAERIVEAQTFFVRHVDPNLVSPDDMAEVMRADGIDERYIAQFKANPWEWTSPEALVQFGKRAAERKEYLTADKDRRLLANHVLYLNNELAKAKARPGQVVGNIQRGLNQAPSVTSASASTPRSARSVDPTRMTIAELDAALKNAGMN